MPVTVAPAVPADTADLTSWPAATKVGYVVCAPGGEGRRLRVAVTQQGTLEVEGVGTYDILEEVPVAERRAGLAALRSGSI
jgi:hypothetical protein